MTVMVHSRSFRHLLEEAIDVLDMVGAWKSNWRVRTEGCRNQQLSQEERLNKPKEGALLKPFEC